MLTSINEESSFENNINGAINAIKSNKYDLACKYLYADMIENDHSAEVYNLLGVISEYKGDAILAVNIIELHTYLIQLINQQIKI